MAFTEIHFPAVVRVSRALAGPLKDPAALLRPYLDGLSLADFFTEDLASLLPVDSIETSSSYRKGRSNVLILIEIYILILVYRSLEHGILSLARAASGAPGIFTLQP
jgi:hypothetical protein